MRAIGVWLTMAAACAAGGCAASRPPGVTSAPSPQITAPGDNTSGAQLACASFGSASALAFQPAVSLGEAPLDLSRDRRQPSAFFGFQGPIVEYYHIQTTDTQISGGGCYGLGLGFGGGLGYSDRYERRAYIDKYGSVQR